MPAIETEIASIPPLSPGEASLVNMHSVINVLSVLHGELYMLGHHLSASDELAPALERCESIQRDLADPSAALRHVDAIADHKRNILHLVDGALHRRQDRSGSSEVAESVANIHSVFAVFDVRARELQARARAPGEWIEMSIEALRADFQQVFSAIERNSRGRYRIIYNLARQESADYYVDLALESENHHSIVMPLVFKDVMRDLMANARKYTPLGGTINAGLYQTRELLKFTVQDTGCGIPPAELATVVHYGQRGSNVGHLRTHGGGFGLTKAFLVTKQFGGRFWIRSELGVGTRIRIEIPRPTTLG